MGDGKGAVEGCCGSAFEVNWRSFGGVQVSRARTGARWERRQLRIKPSNIFQVGNGPALFAEVILGEGGIS